MSKNVKRTRPIYHRDNEMRYPDGAHVYRALPTLKPRGSKPCKCGRTISANKDQCAGCAGV